MLGFVVRRLRGRLPLAAAVLLTVLITTAVLTALVAFNRTVGEAGLRQALQGSAWSRTTVLVSADHGFDKRPKDDAAVGVYAGQLFGDLPVRTESVARSRSYGLPDTAAAQPPGTPAAAPAGSGAGAQPGANSGAQAEKGPGKPPELTVLAALDHDRVTLLSGGWPAAAAGTGKGAVEAAVPQTSLTRLGLTAAMLPAEVRLEDRFDGSPLVVRVTGVYRAADPGDPYWSLDPLGGREIQVGGFTTYGPLLIDDSLFTTARLPQNGRSWLLGADFTGVRSSGAGAIRDRAEGLGADLKKATGLQVRTELPDVLRESDSSALVSRSTLLIGALQLTVLAAAVLLLVVHLMAARQESENALLAARGASGGRLGVFTAAESLLLALPAALLAPLLTPLLLHLLAGYGPLARVPLDTGLHWTLWPVAAVCALACVVVTTAPAVLRGAAGAAMRRAGKRQAMVAGAVRSGADLAVVGLAGLAYYQLAQYNGGLSADATGRLGLDPVLIAAPTLALCAGTLLVLRLLPFAARLGGRMAARGRGLVPALAGWQLARRPGRAAGPVLLLVLAVSTGVLALGQHSTWSASQRDQADYATAGGLRISGSPLAPMGQAGRYGDLPGGDRLIPVIRQESTLPNGAVGQVLALDTAAFAERVPVRSDLLDGQSRRELFVPLAEPAPTGAQAGLPLPGRPQRIDVDVTVTSAKPTDEHPDVWLLLRDRFGSTYRAPLAGVPATGDALATVDLAALTGAPVGSAGAPLTLAGLVVVHGWDQRLPPTVTLTGELTVRRVGVSDTAGGPATTVPLPAGLDWTTVAPAGAAKPSGTVVPARAGEQQVLKVGYRGEGTVSQVTVLPAGSPVPQSVSGVATHAYLTAVGAAVGDTVQVPFGDISLPVKVTGAVGSLPVVGDTALAIDLPTTGRLFAAGGRQLPSTREWWLPAAGPGDPVPAAAAAKLRAEPGGQKLLLNDQVAAELLADPLSAAPQSALAAIALVSTVLAAIGFAAASAASARERTGEFTVLLALGAPRRWLVRTVTAEQGILVGLGSVVGLALGTLTVHLVVPLVVLTPAARRPVPEALVGLPLGWAALLAATITAVALLSALLTGRRRRDVAARLRHVEEM
ncbi:FtsX-like permease family protein [Kitasatospora sp. NPDC050467]|uniref:FtsX-like permease family protein n=1 Tax=Kitasatospora sp. NPDC050467 TaxID=3364053 RepID=UPI00379D2C4D